MRWQRAGEAHVVEEQRGELGQRQPLAAEHRRGERGVAQLEILEIAERAEHCQRAAAHAIAVHVQIRECGALRQFGWQRAAQAVRVGVRNFQLAQRCQHANVTCQIDILFDMILDNEI